MLSITLFRIFSKITGTRRADDRREQHRSDHRLRERVDRLQQTITMPALLLMGFDMDAVKVAMTVGVLGGLLGILMMIPLRRAFIVKQHGKLTYPEGTACADVLIVGEQGGATARTVFAGVRAGLRLQIRDAGDAPVEERRWTCRSSTKGFGQGTARRGVRQRTGAGNFSASDTSSAPASVRPCSPGECWRIW